MSIVLNGINQRVASLADLTPILGLDASVSYWFRTTLVGGGAIWDSPGVVAIEQGGGSNDFFYGVLTSGGQMRCAMGNNSPINGSTVINDDAWHHLVVTRTQAPNLMALYLDGLLEASATTDAGTKTLALNSWGVEEDTGGTPRWWANRVDDLRIYDRAITAEEVAAIYATRGHDGILDGLRSRWPVTGAPGGTALAVPDVAEDQNGGTAENSPTYDSTELTLRRRAA